MAFRILMALVCSAALAACSSTGADRPASRQAERDPGAEREALLSVFTDPSAASAPRTVVPQPIVTAPEPQRLAREVEVQPEPEKRPQPQPQPQPQAQMPAPRGTDTTQLAMTTPTPSAVNPVETLPPQRLVTGQCGMFLWVKKTQAKLVLFSLGAKSMARMNLGGTITDLNRASRSGQSVFGQFTEQRFTQDGYVIDLSLDFERRSDIVGGVLIPNGRMRIQDPQGWSFVMPVGGMIGCQAE